MKTDVRFFLLTLFLGGLCGSIIGQNPQNWKFSTKNLTLEEAYLSLNGEPYLKNDFPMGSTARLVFDGIKGYQLKDGKAFPRMSMLVKEAKASGRIILQYDNLLKAYESTGVDAADAGRLSAELTIGDPMKIGEKYIWQLLITESAGKGKIDLSYDFEVIAGNTAATPPPTEKFIFDTKELEIEEVRLEIDGKAYTATNLPYQAKVDMVFTGITGLIQQNDMVYPGLAIRVTDRSGKLILLESDLLAQYDRRGLAPPEATRLVSTLTIGEPMRVGQLYTWEVHIWDKIWPKKTVDAVLQFTVLP